MADTLRTDYQDDVLDAEVNEYRVYDIVDGNGTVVAANVHLEERTVYSQTGDDYGSDDINEQNTFINGLKATFFQTLTDLKATAIAQAVGVTVSDTFAQVIAKLGAIINRGKVTKTLSGGETYTIPDGYHNGQGTVSAPAQTGTYKPTQRKNNNDMGATNTYRYVDTTAVPNSNSQTYSVTSNGTKDMGETNIYRYVSVAVPNSLSVTAGYNVTEGVNGTWTKQYTLSGYTKYLVILGFKTSGANPQANGSSGMSISRLVSLAPSSLYGSLIVYLCVGNGTITINGSGSLDNVSIIGLKN